MTDQSKKSDPETGTEDDEVGYCKPPKATRFKPGQSGNPAGRRKRPKTVSDQLEDILKRKVPVTQSGRAKRIPLQELMLTTLVNNAVKGDLAALKVVMDLKSSHEGANRETIDLSLLASESQGIIENFLSNATGPEDRVDRTNVDEPIETGDQDDHQS